MAGVPLMVVARNLGHADGENTGSIPVGVTNALKVVGLRPAEAILIVGRLKVGEIAGQNLPVVLDHGAARFQAFVELLASFFGI